MPNMGFRPMEVHTLKASRIRLSIATNANQGATVLEPSDFRRLKVQMHVMDLDGGFSDTKVDLMT